MVEPNGSRIGSLRAQEILLIAILGLAAILRLWALGHGIPYAVGVDEPEVLERAVNMMKSGSPHPHFFDYPSLYIYLQAATACLRFIYGAVSGSWASLEQASPGDFYEWGRAVTALFGVATVFVVYRIGLRRGTLHALLAAGLMAILPIHVRESHYVLTDVPLTFFVSLSMLLTLRAADAGTITAFAWAGAAAGLATATKYNGALVLVLPLIASLATTPRQSSRLALLRASVGAYCLAFLVGAPYTILDLPAFLNGFARLSSEYRTRPALPEPGWLLYMKHLRLVLGPPAYYLLGAGVIVGLLRLRRRAEVVQWTTLAVFPLLYFAFVGGQRLIFARYLLPITPAVCLLIAETIVICGNTLRAFTPHPAGRPAALVLVALVAFWYPTRQAVDFDRMIARRGTVDFAYDWIYANVAKGARVAIETRALLLPPHDYKATNFPRLISDHLTHAPREYETYLHENYEYVVASSAAYGPALAAPQKAPTDYAAYMRLFEQSVELVRFTPSTERPGPELRIFRLRRGQALSSSDTARSVAFLSGPTERRFIR
jgi:hypothetical protein